MEFKVGDEVEITPDVDYIWNHTGLKAGAVFIIDDINGECSKGGVWVNTRGNDISSMYLKHTKPSTKTLKETNMKKCIIATYEKTEDAVVVEFWSGAMGLKDDFATQVLINTGQNKAKFLAEAKRLEAESNK